ncbi:MAG: hypothetical protein JXA99_15590 [Candidatus Lokiarchaeota archaeon]|nr:hypothetical protein [Candidatus Lokiarchaeota archaeon]
MYISFLQDSGWSNVTIISDDNNRWNNDINENPDIAIDNTGKPHIVWSDRTNSS